MKIVEFQQRIIKLWKFETNPIDNLEIHENHRIQIEIYENNENHRITFEDHKTRENLKFLYENQ